MELIRLAYLGTKPYNDKRHGSFSVWLPGDEKLVSHEAARKLLKFVEFAKANESADTAQATARAPQDPYEAAAIAESAAANKTTEDQSTQTDQQQPAELANEQAAMLAKLQEEQSRQRDIDNEKESMLLHISNWDKDQLKDYAAKYDVNINKSRNLQGIREEVSGLVEIFGVR